MAGRLPEPAGARVRGGGLALWRRGSTEDPPAAVLPPAGGSAVRFDARRVPHAVEPLEPGADRWTLVLWLSDRPRRPPRPLLPVPEPDAGGGAAPLDDPPVAEGTVILRRRLEGAPAIVGPAEGRSAPPSSPPSAAPARPWTPGAGTTWSWEPGGCWWSWMARTRRAPLIPEGRRTGE